MTIHNDKSTEYHNAIRSIFENLQYSSKKPDIKVILETSAIKEIRISMRAGQVMKTHKSPFPIVIHVLQGAIKLGILSETYEMKSGDMIGLEGHIPHDLTATEDTVIRLSISHSDTAKRIEKVINTSE
ncbi:cupin domain-containing protein [Sphingobacterium spiritivorum]|uniref:cupin domain-containing protein n=1 Tax=Sphingobacterium spiritivorum TaxID=258 RepID=UPI001918C4B2|nr:cupin domain-containing protein [Sphingobacterium spiritivorum]QQT26438.1 cupin domain-containing protein [Sphingobacterium spiritivorum]